MENQEDVLQKENETFNDSHTDSAEEIINDENVDATASPADEEVSAQPEKKKNKRKTVLIICGAVLGAILLIAAVLFFIMKGYLGRIQRFDGTEQTLSSDEIASLNNQEATNPEFSGPVMDGSEIKVPSESAASVMKDEHIVNILLVGQDRRKGEGRRHSDSMVLVTVNKKTKTITMTSFMRDLWVPIPDHYNERLNVPYMVGGFDLLNKTLDHNFGIAADYNVEVDFEGFESIIDAIGGIDMYLSAAEASYLNRRGNWSNGEKYKGDWTLQQGMNHLTGKQALAYSRIRDLDSDFGRTNRQRKVLKTLLATAKQMNSVKLMNTVKSLASLVKTDMTDGQIVSLVTELLPILPEAEVVSQRIPADGAYSSVRLIDNGYAKDVLIMDDADLQTNIALLTQAYKIEKDETADLTGE